MKFYIVFNTSYISLLKLEKTIIIFFRLILCFWTSFYCLI